MPIDLRKFEKLKANVERLERDKAKAEGALEQTMAVLKKEFGVETLEEAEGMLKQLEEESKLALDEYEAALAEFEEEWNDKF